MSLPTYSGNTNYVQGLEDYPNDSGAIPLTPAQLKAVYDQFGTEFKIWINTIFIPDCIASNIPLNTIVGLASTELQSAIAELKGIDDANKAYLLAQMAGIILGQITDGSLTDIKLSNAAGQIKDSFSLHKVDYTLQVPYGGTTTNVGNAYSIAAPAITALVVGMAITVKCNADATGAVTLNWNTKGAKNVLKSNGTAVTNWKNGGVYTLRYDGTSFQLQGEGGSGDAIASDLALGKKASTDAGDIVGTSTKVLGTGDTVNTVALVNTPLFVKWARLDNDSYSAAWISPGDGYLYRLYTNSTNLYIQQYNLSTGAYITSSASLGTPTVATYVPVYPCSDGYYFFATSNSAGYRALGMARGYSIPLRGGVLLFNGNYYVGNFGNTFYKITPSTGATAWSKTGTGTTYACKGVKDYAGNYIWFTSSATDTTLQKYDEAGTLQDTKTITGRVNYGFEMLSNGNFIIVEYLNSGATYNLVCRNSSTMAIVWEITQATFGDTPYTQGSSLVVDSSGYIWYATRDYIFRINSSGTIVGKLNGFNSNCGFNIVPDLLNPTDSVLVVGVGCSYGSVIMSLKASAVLI